MQREILPDLLSFATLVEAQSFTEAAKLLGFSHSVLSRRISQLEKVLGSHLLIRSTRRLSLTEAGRVLYERCVRIRSEVEEATTALEQANSQPRGTLRISSPMSFGHLHLVPAISEFMRVYKDIKIELSLGSRFLHNLIEGGIDLAIHVKEVPDSNVIAKRIALRRMHVCASPEYFAHHSVPKTPQDLSDHNCLLYQLQTTKHEWGFIDNQTECFVKVNGNFKANSSRALASAALSGLGIAKLPGYLVAPYLQQGKLISVLGQYCPRDIGIYAVYPHRQLNLKTKLFIDYLTDRFSSEYYWNDEELEHSDRLKALPL